MSLPKELTTVTPLSKYLSMILFIILPFVGLYLGIKYQSRFQGNPQVESNCLNPQRVPQPSTNFCPTVINRPVYVEYDSSVVDKRTWEEKTKAWKTFRSNTFSFKYPPDWEVIDLLRINSNMPGLKNTNVYVGIGPVTLGVDTLANIRVPPIPLKR